MSICDPCKRAAELPDPPLLPHCPVCDRQIGAHVSWGPDFDDATGLLNRHAKLVWHKRAPGLPACNGVGWEAVYAPPKDQRSGHHDCKGCPCQHRPKGSWKGGRK